ncbi:MAG: hypothetical protein FWC24_01895 [Treponema sp.]|nr:hypothetical protein [Treponema sp.]
MDLISLANDVYLAVIYIDTGRKGWATKGKEAEGRVAFEYGINLAMSSFKEAQTSVDPQALILAEYTFICQELQLCSETDNDSLGSLTQARQSFDDAFLTLQVVENCAFYKEADKTYPHYKNYRTNGFPKDAFHIACIAHKTRLQNTLRATGIDPIEKALLKQRLANLTTAQRGYITKQKKALTVSE